MIKPFTSEEQAIEVYNLFYNINNLPLIDNGTNAYLSRNMAIQCAIIFVNDKIISNAGGRRQDENARDYWGRVKDELINMIK